MVEGSNRIDLEKWLSNKPKEWEQVLANRCALRVMPVLGGAIKYSNLSEVILNQLTLATMRASLTSEVAVVSSALEIKGFATSAARVADEVGSRLSPDNSVFVAGSSLDFGYARAAGAAAVASARAIDAPSLTPYATLKTLSAYVAPHGKNVGDATGLAAVAAGASDVALENDVRWLQNHENNEYCPQNLLLMPLWQGEKNPLLLEWESFKEALKKIDPNWQFWIDWYQSKLNGTLHPGLTQSQQENLYYQIATFPNELWEEGAEAVNRRIAELMEEIKKSEVNDLEVEVEQPFDLEIPPQNKGALQFKTNEDGIIELDHEAIENELLNDQDAIDRHNEVDYLANELISSYDPNSSSANAARPIVTKVQRYLEALGDTPEVANINFIIPRGEVLRQELEREENRDEFTSSPPLPDNFKSSLTSLVRAHNIYVLLDPVLDKRDQARLGPDAKENLVSKEEGLKFVEDAFKEGLIEEEIAETFHEEAETVHETPDPDRRQDRRFSESIKNFSRLLLSNTQKIAKKIKENQADIIEVATASGIGAGSVLLVTNATWTIIGGALGVGVTCFKGLQWVVKNEEWIIQRFDNKEEVKAFIETLKKWPIK